MASMAGGSPCALRASLTPAANDMPASTRRKGRRRVRSAASAPPIAAARKISASGTAAAHTAFLIGVLYAAVSAYWGFGGTWLLNTIGGTLEREGRTGAAGARLLVWTAALLKLTAALVGLKATTRQHRLTPGRRRRARQAAWAAALILTVYGGVLTAIGLLIQLDLVHASPTADHPALRWHAYLWDPWFLVWGLLLATALARSRSHTVRPD
jgi:uncharacterized protein DUF3995